MADVLLLNSSPRRYGYTKKMLLAARLGAEDRGCSTSIIDLYDYDIKPCQGCVSDEVTLCKYPCPIKDDFRVIGDMLLDSGGLVIGSPIYWYGPSGALKNLVDRLTSMENMIHHVGYSLLDGKPVGFVVAGNDTGAIMSISYLMGVFNSMGCLIPPWALAYHHSLDDVVTNRAAIIDAYNVGVNVCRAYKEDVERKGEREIWYKDTVDTDRLIEYIRTQVRGKDEEEHMKRKTRYKLLGEENNDV